MTTAIETASPALKAAIASAAAGGGNFTAAWRLPGGADSNVNSGGTDAFTGYYKLQTDAPVSRVRLHIYGKESTASTGYYAAVAATETNARDTQNNRYTPVVGGTSVNSAWSTSNPYGWRSVTWGGGGATGSLAIGASTRPAETVSDWIECSSVPRADGGSGYLTMLRIFHDGTANGPHSKIGSSGSPSYRFDAWLAAKAANETFYRDCLAALVSTTNGVTTLTTMPSGDYGDNNWYHWFALEFDFAVAVRSVMMIGTSITTGGGGQIYAFDNWGTRAVLSKSTTATPLFPFNGGMSGNGTTNYLQELTDLISNGARPTDVVIEGMHPNDGGSSFGLNQSRQMQILGAIKACRAIGARVFLTTGMPNNGYAGAAGTNTAEGARLAANAWIRSVCATGIATLVDMDAVMTDGGSPARGKLINGNSVLQPDGIHPSIYGLPLMAAQLQAAL